MNYLTMKRTELLIQTTAWIISKNIDLSQRSLTQDYVYTYCMIPFIRSSRTGKTNLWEKKSELLLPPGWGGGSEGLTKKGHEETF